MAADSTRRAVIGASLAGLAAIRPASGAPTAPLASLAAQKGRVFGSAMRQTQIHGDVALTDILLRECAWLTPEIEMKWAVLEPQEGRFDFTAMDALADLARAQNKKLRGHTLLWHNSIPPWAVQRLAEKPDWTLLSRLFGAVIQRYGDVVTQWDVVNEPILTGSRMDGLRDGPFLKAFGPGYIGMALNEARNHAPYRPLMINEYGLEYDLVPEKDRRYLFLKLIENLRRSGVPLDGIGLQSHLDLTRGPVSRQSMTALLDALVDLGLFVVVTELDVKEADLLSTPGQRNQAVADEVARYLDIVLAHPAVKGVLTWGLSNRTSWLKITNDDLKRFPGAWADGSGPGLNRGLPFDSDLMPTPMYRAIATAFDR